MVMIHPGASYHECSDSSGNEEPHLHLSCAADRRLTARPATDSSRLANDLFCLEIDYNNPAGGIADRLHVFSVLVANQLANIIDRLVLMRCCMSTGYDVTAISECRKREGFAGV
jgi:hypothetical protein